MAHGRGFLTGTALLISLEPVSSPPVCLWRWKTPWEEGSKAWQTANWEEKTWSEAEKVLSAEWGFSHLAEISFLVFNMPSVFQSSVWMYGAMEGGNTKLELGLSQGWEGLSEMGFLTRNHLLQPGWEDGHQIWTMVKMEYRAQWEGDQVQHEIQDCWMDGAMEGGRVQSRIQEIFSGLKPDWLSSWEGFDSCMPVFRIDRWKLPWEEDNLILEPRLRRTGWEWWDCCKAWQRSSDE